MTFIARESFMIHIRKERESESQNVDHFTSQIAA